MRYQYDYHVKTWKGWHRPAAEYYEIEWFDHRESKWHTSWSFVHDKTAHDIEDYLRRDVAYFYDFIPIRVVKIQRTIVRNTFGSQTR